MDWQGIETAPKSNLEVILVTHFDAWPRVALWDGTKWLMVQSQGGTVPYEPTHWMKLPEPPKAGA
jgi:hypothetical protein